MAPQMKDERRAGGKPAGQAIDDEANDARPRRAVFSFSSGAACAQEKTLGE